MKRKIFGFCLVFLIALMLPITVKADENKFENYKCIVPFDLGLEYDGNEKTLRSGYGILVGFGEDGGAGNIIANASDVRATGEELQAFYDELAIEEDKRDQVKQTIKVTVDKDIQIDASINNVSDSMNLAVLNTTGKIYNHTSVLFDIDEDNIKPAQELYILDYESNCHVGYAVNENQINGIKYIQFDSPLDWEQRGQAVFNENEEFIGMIQDSVDGTHKNALSSKEIAVALKTLGINIDVVDHTIKPVEKQILISATDMADKMDLSLYTEESANNMREKIQIARSVIISEEATQEEVDAAYAMLNEAQDALVIDKKLDTITLVFIIVSGVLLLGIIIFIIVLIIVKKNKKKKEKAKAEIDAKRAPVNNGPYVPNANKNKQEVKSTGRKSDVFTRVQQTSTELGKSYTSTNMGSSEKLTNLSGFAPSSKAINLNEEDTTVLSVVEDQMKEEAKIKAHLILPDGNRIDINKNEFTIGKSIQKSDFSVDSKSVSRSHITIISKDGNYFVKDLSSLNGTFVNGEKINPQEEKAIKNEDSIKIADIEMKFFVD